MIVDVSRRSLKKALADKEERIVLGGNASPLIVLVIIGVPFAFMAYIATVVSGVTSSKANAVDYTFLALVVVTLATLAYLLAGWTNRLTLDRTGRIYIWEYGFHPFIKRQQGSLDEFQHLSLARQMAKGLHGSYTYLILRLVPKDGAPPDAPPGITVSGAQDRWGCAELLPLAEDLARKVGLPFRNEYEKEPAASIWSGYGKPSGPFS